MPRLFRRLLVASVLMTGALAAAPLERDLGSGLVYFRVHTLPADLPADDAVKKRPCVLDLRFVGGNAAATAVLDGWLKFHAAAKTPILCLINSATSPTVLAALEHRDDLPGFLTLGTATHGVTPDVTTAQSAESEKRAYDALEAGTDVATLTTDNPSKQRNDEASLAKERVLEPAPAGDAAGSEIAGAPDRTRTPPIDEALQRAIHVHRALKASKRI